MLRGMDLRLHDFKGFDDFVEIFKSGTHTDANGITEKYTNNDLDDIIRNHNETDPAPIVIGHPKTNDPAFGWVGELKRDGGSLLFKAKEVEPEFAKMVAAGRYRKRSVRIRKSTNGYALKHVGFLGAKPPAIGGLAAMNFAEADSETHDFEADSYTPNILARTLRRLREHFISKDGMEVADQILPNYEIEALTDYSNELDKQNKESASAFSEPNNNDDRGGDTVMSFSQEEVDKAAKTAADKAKKDAEAEFAENETNLKQQLADEKRKRLTKEFQSEIDSLVDAGKLTPAQAEGMPEFMLGLSDEAEAEFEFSQGEGDKKSTIKKSPIAWFRQFAESLGKQIDMSEHKGGDGKDLDATDPVAIAKAAREFQQSEQNAGREITTAQAVRHVTEGGES